MSSGIRNFKIIKSEYSDWGTVLNNPAEITVEVLHVGNVPGTVHKITAFNEEQKKQIEDRKFKAPLFSYLIRHGEQGDFLVDTGFDSQYAEVPWGHFKGSYKEQIRYEVERGKGIDNILEDRGIRLNGVFCTHFHEHQGGAPSLPDDIAFIFGQGEEEMNKAPYLYTEFLKEKTDKQAIDFDLADDMPVVGKAVDVFGDGSFWAIHTPGHTDGHISYLVNGLAGQYLITGDVCMCIQSYELGLESGGEYASDPVRNRESFLKMRNFLQTWPQVKPLFGHETEECRIACI